MQKLLSITYAFLILFQSISFEVRDLVHLDTFFEHAEFHKQAYGDSFLQFIAEHYGNSREEHQGDHQHEDLPFQHEHQMCSHLSPVFTFENSNIEFDQIEFVEIPCNFFYKESNSIFEKYPLLQPPKTA